MTKSTITRERAQQIFLGNGPEPSASEERELARMTLVAMDSEPVAEVLSNRPGNDTSTIDTALPVGTQLYRHAQPVTVVPDEVTAEYCPALVKYDVTEVDEAWARGFNACRAAVLQAKSLYSINPAPDLVSLQKKAESIIGNYPGIPDGSEHCPCCGKKLRRACSVEGCGGKHVAHGLCQKHYDMKRWEDPEQVERFREADRRYRGKKKTTVTTPQEPKP
ncbi:TPA: hypothetical protein L8S39_001274 [Klebsiella pneumoniae]|nr:hypothetical protein [Klebsiella pneumoniae]HBQ7862707.1 hypothetical protein [Klebsiella pneumoniae]HBQ7873792.1 hypothetical protein [Klebsiella pneumoniae]HBQ7879609.1 hypothetical protein [Klebsiella pneumoniae]HBQ7890739.1 hypothetical protein [Klebsiella pneumoniae]